LQSLLEGVELARALPRRSGIAAFAAALTLGLGRWTIPKIRIHWLSQKMMVGAIQMADMKVWA